MIKKYHKWKDRRENSKVKPLIYLSVELIALAMISWIVFKLAPLWAAVIVTAASIYLFLTNCLKRYYKIKERQHYYENSESEDKE